MLGEEELVAEFAYDYAGRRVRHDGRFVYLGDGAGGAGDPIPSDTRFSIYDQQAALAEYHLVGNQFEKSCQYIYGADLLAAERSDEGSDLSTSFYHQDALGSTVNLTGPDGAATAGYLYDAWGNYRELDVDGQFDSTPDLDSSNLNAWESYLANVQDAWSPVSLLPSPGFSGDWNRFTYTGHEFDPETGLYYFKARFYDLELGRFFSADPYLGESLAPPSLHRYLYAFDSPLRYVDLTGYATEEKPLYERAWNWIQARADEVAEVAENAGEKFAEKFVEGATDVVVQPVRLVQDLGTVAGVAIYNSNASQKVYSEDVKLKSKLGQSMQARVERGESPLQAMGGGLLDTYASLDPMTSAYVDTYHYGCGAIDVIRGKKRLGDVVVESAGDTGYRTGGVAAGLALGGAETAASRGGVALRQSTFFQSSRFFSSESAAVRYFQNQLSRVNDRGFVRIGSEVPNVEPIQGSGGTGKVYEIPAAELEAGKPYIGRTRRTVPERMTDADHRAKTPTGKPPKASTLAENLTPNETAGLEYLLAEERGLENLSNKIPPLNPNLKKNAVRIEEAKKIIEKYKSQEGVQ